MNEQWTGQRFMWTWTLSKIKMEKHCYTYSVPIFSSLLYMYVDVNARIIHSIIITNNVFPKKLFLQ